MEREDMDWTEVAPDIIQWRDFVSMVVNIQVA
jgi:hypothetical protein